MPSLILRHYHRKGKFASKSPITNRSWPMYGGCKSCLTNCFCLEKFTERSPLRKVCSGKIKFFAGNRSFSAKQYICLFEFICGWDVKIYYITFAGEEKTVVFSYVRFCVISFRFQVFKALLRYISGGFIAIYIGI